MGIFLLAPDTSGASQEPHVYKTRDFTLKTLTGAKNPSSF